MFHVTSLTELADIYLIVHELESEGGFAHTATAHHDHFVNDGLGRLGCLGRHGCWMVAMMRWCRRMMILCLFYKSETLEPDPGALDPGRTGRAVLGRCGSRRCGGHVGWGLAVGRGPGEGEDLAVRILGLTSPLLNGQAHVTRPLGHALSDGLPILSHFDTHFLNTKRNSNSSARRREAD